MTHDDDESSNGDGIPPNKIELFDRYFEVWSPLNTEGTPHPGLNGAAKVLFGKRMYMYGGIQDMRMDMYTGVLSLSGSEYVHMVITLPCWNFRRAN